MRDLGNRLYEAADSLNRRNILELVTDGPYRACCDLGCNDGEWTSQLAQRSRSRRLFGIEIAREAAQIAQSRHLRVVISDLSAGFPFQNGSFDLIHANQVIEHVTQVDHFLKEANRVLRVGGVFICSTENGSSWHNVFAAAMGWQIFSLTNVSTRVTGVGNPFALHRRDRAYRPSWTHKTIFNYRGFIEIIEAHAFNVIAVRGAGYYPLPAVFGRIDPRHAHFISVKAIKTDDLSEI